MTHEDPITSNSYDPADEIRQAADKMIYYVRHVIDAYQAGDPHNVLPQLMFQLAAVRDEFDSATHHNGNGDK